MNEESLFAAALEKPTAAARRAFLDRRAAATRPCGSGWSGCSPPTATPVGILERGPDGVAT